MSQLHSRDYAGHADAAPPQSPVQGTLAGLASEQAETHGLLAELEERLTWVLPHAEPEKPKTGPQSIPLGASPLHGDLCLRVEDSRSHNNRLRKILAGLTL